jgi:hypothetical protein
MRRPWGGLALVFALVCTLAGCATEDHLKPPKQPESYALPPTSVTRFSEPPNYPRKYLMEDLASKNLDPSMPNSPLRRTGGIGGPGGAARDY